MTPKSSISTSSMVFPARSIPYPHFHACAIIHFYGGDTNGPTLSPQTSIVCPSIHLSTTAFAKKQPDLFLKKLSWLVKQYVSSVSGESPSLSLFRMKTRASAVALCAIVETCTHRVPADSISMFNERFAPGIYKALLNGIADYSEERGDVVR